jgi:hypothetical protein
MKCTNLNQQWKCINTKPEPKPEPEPECINKSGDTCIQTDTSSCCIKGLQCGPNNTCVYPCGEKVNSKCHLSKCCITPMKCIANICKYSCGEKEGEGC